jgi:subtilisin family serine protease
VIESGLTDASPVQQQSVIRNQRPVSPRVRHRAAVAALCACALTLVVTSPVAVAKPGPSDPVQSGVAPVEKSDWWFEVMHLDKAQLQTQGAGAKIGLLEDTLDPTIPELRGAKLRRGGTCSAVARAEVEPGGSDPAVEHGTGMATLILGNGRGTDHGQGIRGVAPKASLTLFGTGTKENGEWTDCVVDLGYDTLSKAILASGVSIINMSYSAAQLPGELDWALDAGVVMVAANPIVSDYVMTPAATPGVVGVAAAGPDGRRWKMSARGGQVAVSAPGVEIGAGTIEPGRGWRSDVWHDGTSAAAAITTGALALVKSRYPDATGNQLIQQLIHYTGGYRDRPFRWHDDLGYGSVSVTNMLETSPTQWPDENPLLKGPPAAQKDYPMWASSLIDAPSGVHDKWAEAERAEKADKKASGTSSAGRDTSASGGSGQAWPWAIGAGLLALLAAAAVVARRLLGKGNS